MPDIESDIGRDNVIDDADCPEQRDVSAAPNVPRLIWPTQIPQRYRNTMLLTVSAIETIRNKGVKEKLVGFCQCFASVFTWLGQEIQLEIYSGEW
jgi:hypothetical protein